jgi:PAS domain S-box-containing protein
LETHWNEATASQRVVTYTTLPVGKYDFRVQAKVNRSEWSQPGLALAIRVLPAWWNTWQFRTVWITLLLLLTWFVYQFRVHQLQRQSKQLRDVIDTIPGSVWSALPDGSLDFINQRWLEFSGVSLEEGLGWGWEAAVHPDDLARFVDEWRAAVASGKAMESEARVRRADGQYRWLLIRNVPLQDKGGKIVKWYGTSTDIDDRKRVEEALRRSNRELRAISNCNQTLLRATDEQSLLEEICRIVCEEAGYRMAWVAYAEHDEVKSVRPAAWTGTEEGYLTSLGITWADTEHGWGPTGTAIRSGKTCCIQDFATHPRLAPWRESTLQRDFRSGIALPLMDEHANPFGSLTIYSTQPNAFTSEETRLLEELAADLAFGIVTLRSRAARQRAEQEVALLSSALDKVREAAFLIDDRGRFHYVNEEACRVLGYPRAELLGMGVADIDPEFPAERWSDHWRDLKAQRSLSFESRHRTRDGRTFPVEISANYFEFGGQAYNLALVRDITERKRAEEALRQSEAYLAEAQRLSHTGSWASESTGRPLYWSEELFRIFGFDPQQGVPTPEKPLQRIHPEDLDKFLGTFERAVQAKVDFEVKARVVLPDGTVKHIHGIGHPVLNANGEIVEVVGTVLDITERKRAEEERERLHQLETDLAHINRVSMMGELAASIAHEVNQPLSGIVSNGSACLRFLARDTPNVEEAREAARDIVRDGKRTGEVIARIRALTKRAATPREKLDLNETIREILALIRDEANKKGVIIRTQFADHLSPISGDRVQLQQVMLNLVMNAVEAMGTVDERPPELAIATRNIDPDQVQVTVKDSGVGLDPSTIGRIFDPLYTTKPGGMGMGLSISRSILQTHGGRLWATVNDGPGTSFHFTVPKCQDEESNAGV